MRRCDNLVVVAGTGRDVGKTAFVCELISTFSTRTEVYGLKVSSIQPDEGIYHGDHSGCGARGVLVEETRADLDKDTSRMIRAGAARVFYLRGDDEQILAGFDAFLATIPPHAAIVCESGSLWKFVEPGLLIMVTMRGRPVKKRAQTLAERASLVVESRGEGGFPELSRIRLNNASGWAIDEER